MLTVAGLRFLAQAKGPGMMGKALGALGLRVLLMPKSKIRRGGMN